MEKNKVKPKSLGWHLVSGMSCKAAYKRLQYPLCLYITISFRI